MFPVFKNEKLMTFTEVGTIKVPGWIGGQHQRRRTEEKH